MTIVQYITPSRMGGAEAYFLRLCEFLARRGHRVIVLTKRDALLRVEAEKLKPIGVEVYGWHTRGKFDLWTLIRLVHLLRRERVEIINTHLTTAAWMGAWAGKIARVPCAAWIHGRDEKTWFQWADVLIVVAEAVREFLIEQGVSPRRIELHYLGVDVKEFSPFSPAQKLAAKAGFGLSPSARTVAVIGHFSPRKGHRFLIEALALLPRDVELLLAGEGVLEPELRAQATALGVGERVHFLGFQGDVKGVLSATDVFCLPSLKEGLPLSVMEAQACGVVVVASQMAGVPEVVREGETGFLCRVGDAASLRRAIERALRSLDANENIGAHARAFMTDHFASQEQLEGVEAFLLRMSRAKPRK